MNIGTDTRGEVERERIRDLLRLIPRAGGSALDIGARDGYIARLLADSFDSVTALDLSVPPMRDERIRWIQGDVCSLGFPDDAFDLVLCAEVLEHLPAESLLTRACSEIARVTRHSAIIGVPYRQDLRIGRTTCLACGGKNPPWGHVNAFDEERLKTLFPSLRWHAATYVGESRLSKRLRWRHFSWTWPAIRMGRMIRWKRAYIAGRS